MREKEKHLLLYLLKFFGFFCLLFYGTEAVIGFSAPGRHFSPFVAGYLDFIPAFRHSLLVASKALLSACGIGTEIKNPFTLGFVGGRAVRLVYSCLGYGVLSFWIAFVAANRGSWAQKITWAFGGCLAIFTLNVVRISLVLVAANKRWPMPLGWDHHTWFNILCYLLLFLMMYAYSKREKSQRSAKLPPSLRAEPRTVAPQNA